jgi:hypothetical protein
MTKAETTQHALLNDINSIQIRYDQEWRAKIRQLREFTNTLDGSGLRGNLEQAAKLNDLAIKTLYDEIRYEHGHSSDCPHFHAPASRLRGGRPDTKRCFTCRKPGHMYWNCRNYKCPNCFTYQPRHTPGECQYTTPSYYEEPGEVDFGDDGDWNMSGEC